MTGRRSEDGTALVEFTWLGVLLLVPLVWVVLTLFDVQRGTFSITTAARAAGRAFVLAPSEQAGRDRAQAAARQALDDQGLAGAPLALDIRCSLGPGRCLVGTSVVTVRLHTEVPLPWAPSFFGDSAASVRVEATHAVPVGRYLGER